MNGSTRTSARVPTFHAGIAVTERSGVSCEKGNRDVPGNWLDSLAREMKLSGLEWRIAALVMAHGPISVFAVAKALRMDYTQAKRAARGLRAWSILKRTPAGLVFQPDPNGWEQGIKTLPVKPPTGHREPSRPPTAPTALPSAEEEVELVIDRWYR